MTQETVNITKLVNGGYGFAHLGDGQVVLLRHVLPGETVIVTIEEKKKNYLLGKVRQIVAAHPARRSPPCPYAGDCGGCDLQHCRYDCQRNFKKEIIVDLFRRGHRPELRRAANLIGEPAAAPEEFGYRQRIRLQVSDRGVPGFHRFKSHALIPVKACLLAGATLNQTLTALSSHPDGCRLTALSSEVELQENPRTGQVVAIFRLARKPRPADILAAERFGRENRTVERVFLAGELFSLMGPYGLKEGGKSDNRLSIHYPAITGLAKGLELSWEAGSFCQVNLQQNRLLIETVVDFCHGGNSDQLLDLYCGMGNFSIPLAMRGHTVLGIEGQGSAIRGATINAALAGLGNVRFRKSPIHQACAELAAEGARFACVVIDPPRQGAPGLAAHLAALTGDRLVYISCDPATLCRDLGDLVDHGFSIRKIQPVDMFPQTHHIETVVLLSK
jgi:23S rRNA (uracil1939-C5)-methyltransferase